MMRALIVLVGTAALLAQSPETRFQEAQRALSQGHTDHAIAILAELAAQDPMSPVLWVNLGLAHYQKGDYRGAQTPLQKALALDEHLRPALALLGLSKAAIGDWSTAKPLLEKAFHDGSAPLDRELRRLVGIQLSKAYSLDRQPEQAEALFATLMHEYPQDVEVLYHAFWLHLTHGRDVLQILVRTAPTNWRTYQVIGHLLAERENYAAAAEQFRLALRENPKGVGLHYSLGNALAPLAKTPDDRRKAREQFEAELEVNPRHAPSYHQLAELALLDGRHGEALELFERAVRVDSGYAAAHAGVCRVLVIQERSSEALAHCETAVRIDPELREAHYRLSRLYQQLGRTEDAHREMALFRKLDEEAHRQAQYFLGAKMGMPTQ
jgi:tetratricopeptide (TPR) repeat protein